MNHNISAGGYVTLWCYNADGTLAWHTVAKNGVTNQGLNYLGNVSLSGTAARLTSWYAGLISSLTVLLPSDTLSGSPQWTEFTGYSGTRPQWTNSTANQIAASTSTFQWSITANGTINGVFFASDNTIGGTIGTLWATAQISPPVPVIIGQTIVGQYFVTFAGG